VVMRGREKGTKVLMKDLHKLREELLGGMKKDKTRLSRPHDVKSIRGYSLSLLCFCAGIVEKAIIKRSQAGHQKGGGSTIAPQLPLKKLQHHHF